MKYGLIGEKLSHSFSKIIHEKIETYEYELKEVSKLDFDTFMTNKDFLAINVTMPYKKEVIKYLDYVDDLVSRIKAVNVVVNKNGKLYGYNTDYFGFKALVNKSSIKIENQNVAILGGGGSANTIKVVCSDLKAKNIYVVSRSNKDNCISYDELKNIDIDVIINTTPLGMYPNNDAPIDIREFKDIKGVLDIVYNPLRTRLCIDSQNNNIKAYGGLYMLVAQAIKSIELFKEIKLDNEIIDKIYKELLIEKRNIVLIGMPGCGKTTIAKLLSDDYLDTDKLIEEKTGVSIKEIINKYGESYFRDIESKVIEEISNLSHKVIATGGGSILRKENIYNLKKNGLLIYIDRDLNQLELSDDRPLSNNRDSLCKIYSERKDIYEEVCDIKVYNNEYLNKCVEEIGSYENFDY